MITQEFYLDNEKFFANWTFLKQTISLPVYQEKGNQQEKFTLTFYKKDNLVLPLWISEVDHSLLQNKKQLIALQVTFQPDELQNLDEHGNIIINPQKIEGGWQEAGQWLSKNYPTTEDCKFITYLDLSHKMLTGCLNLSNFPRLKEVNCSRNYLTGLIIPEWAKVVNASSNAITSLSNVEANWETINLNLDDNSLNITEIITTIKNLHQNSELERQEIEKLKQSIATIKNNHKNNVQVLQKAHQEEITVAQETIQELDKKLTEKEKELVKKGNKASNSGNLGVNYNAWWPKIKTPVILGVILLVIIGIYYFFRKYLNF